MAAEPAITALRQCTTGIEEKRKLVLQELQTQSKLVRKYQLAH